MKIMIGKSVLVKAFIILLIFGTSVYYHELSHQRIFETYGCEDVKMGMNWHTAFVTANCSEDVMRDVIRDNNFNEVIGYNVTTILLLFLTIYVARM
jgi:hypothetical protein